MADEPIIVPPALDEREHQQLLTDIERRRSPSFDKARPDFDPHQARDVAAQAKDGRKLDDYKQALERCGFVRLLPHQLPPMMSSTGPTLHKEARWYNLRDAARYPTVRMALTDDQVVAWFPSGPGEFWSWYQTALARARAKSVGIALPRAFQVPA